MKKYFLIFAIFFSWVTTIAQPDTTILSTGSFCYLFQTTTGSFIDASPNHRDITAIPASDPYRDATGIHYSGTQNLTVPNRPYKCFIFCQKIPSNATGMLYRMTNGAVSIDASLLNNVGGGVYHSLKEVYRNGAVDQLTQSNLMKGSSWIIGTYIFSAYPNAASICRIGSNGATYKLSAGDIACVVGLEYEPTMDQIEAWHNYIAYKVASKGISIPYVDLPPLINGTTAPAAAPLTSIHSPYSPDDAFAELGVVDMEYELGPGATWAGHRYWMVTAPYPFTQNQYENPCVFNSDDRNTWSVPDSVTNPVIVKPMSGNNSDPALVFRKSDSTMWLYNRMTIGTNTWTCVISSKNGFKTKSAVDTLFLEVGLDDEPGINVTPSVAFDSVNNEWIMISILVNSGASGIRNTFVRRTAPHPDGPWSAETQCSMPDWDWTPWHGNLMWDKYLNCFVYFTSVGVSGSNGAGNLKGKFYSSVDHCNTWYQCRGYNIIASGVATSWNISRIYRTAMTRTSTGYDLYYIANGKGPSSTTVQYRIGWSPITTP